MRGQGSPGLRKQAGQRLLLTNLCLGDSTRGMHCWPLFQGRAGAEGLRGLLKHMCFVVGIVKTKKKRENFVWSLSFNLKFVYKIPDVMEGGSDIQLF